MKRRRFLWLISSTALWPLAAHSQQLSTVRRLAVLMPYANDPTAEARLDLLRQELKVRGWIDGRTIKLEYYFANSDLTLMKSYAKVVSASNPDVIFAASPPVLSALKRDTSAIPIVFTNVTDPVGVGLVESLSHPGGNITGFGAYEFSIAGKWVELLKQIAPTTVKIAVVKMPQHSTNAKLFEAAKPVAASLQINLVEANIRTLNELEGALGAIAKEPGSGLLILPNPVTTDFQARIVELAAQFKLPAIYPYKDLAAGGGLMSYGPNVSEDYRSAAAYIDRILRGEKPGDLPVQAPEKFELLINLKSAKALGLLVPPSMLASADAVIE